MGGPDRTRTIVDVITLELRVIFLMRNMGHDLGGSVVEFGVGRLITHIVG